MISRSLVVMFGLIAGPGPGMAQDYSEAPGVRLRILDKLTAAVGDVTIRNGGAEIFGRLTVKADSCRYPTENRTAEAFAHLTILQDPLPDPVFKGWMVASSPALSALDNARYDVWVIRCDVPDLDLPAAEPEPAEEPATEEGNG